jgi:acetamidase/formamidase
MPATHVIPLGRETLHGHFSIDLPPVLTVDPGDSVRFQALNAGWHWDAGGRWLDDLHPLLDDGHPLTGPIAVRGARAGGTLEVRIDLVRPRGWGVTFAGESALEWQLGGTTGVTEDGAQSVALAPFLGVIGMPPPEPGVHSTTPPRRFGGNIDCKELTRARRCCCRSAWTAPCCRPATATRRRATARCRARRSSARWTKHG